MSSEPVADCCILENAVWHITGYVGSGHTHKEAQAEITQELGYLKVPRRLRRQVREEAMAEWRYGRECLAEGVA